MALIPSQCRAIEYRTHNVPSASYCWLVVAILRDINSFKRAINPLRASEGINQVTRDFNEAVTNNTFIYSCELLLAQDKSIHFVFLNL